MGEAKDNSSVKSITLNGDPVTHKKGEQVFFSRLAKLEEGKNDFVVEAKDTFNNTTTTEAVIERKIPTYKEIGSRMSIAILPLEFSGERSLETDSIYDYLISAFSSQGRFRIIEKENLTAVLEELELGRTELVDKSSAVKIGKLLTADAIITGTARGKESSLEIVTRIVNTETRTILVSEDVYGKDTSFSGVKELAKRLAYKYKQSLPILEGIVMKIDGDSILVDIGEDTKLKKEIGLILFREGEQFKNPRTGKVLKGPPVELGEATVAAVYEGYSKAQVEAETDIQVMDSVITK
jgi:TolB-like protein